MGVLNSNSDTLTCGERSMAEVAALSLRGKGAPDILGNEKQINLS